MGMLANTPVALALQGCVSNEPCGVGCVSEGYVSEGCVSEGYVSESCMVVV